MTTVRTLATVCCLLTFAGCKKGAAPSGGSSSQPNAQMGTRGDFSSADEARTASTAPSDAGASFDGSDMVAQEESRPGLGTEYGEQRRSSVVDVPFVRGSNRPSATLSLFYNDFEGVRAMGGSSHGANSRVSTSDGSFVLSVVDERGRLLPSADIGSQRYAMGGVGQRYQLGIENHSGARHEVVASVDGLDVIDGGEAGFNKRGYILDPFSSVMLEGWRTSQDTVAAFRFSSIDDSYAERRGKGRNIGVIGAAFFHEEGSRRNDPDGRRRHGADPFPGRFAPPPR